MIYTCEGECGFEGSYVDVQEHEKKCERVRSGFALAGADDPEFADEFACDHITAARKREFMQKHHPETLADMESAARACGLDPDDPTSFARAHHTASDAPAQKARVQKSDNTNRARELAAAIHRAATAQGAKDTQVSKESNTSLHTTGSPEGLGYERGLPPARMLCAKCAHALGMKLYDWWPQDGNGP